MKEYTLGHIAGLKISGTPTAMVAALLLWLLLSGLALTVLDFRPGQAILSGLLGVILHWLSEINHHLGHAWAAKRTGYPMIGVRMGLLGLFAASLYPPHEPDLPAGIHIRRAVGGPAGSLLLSLLAAILALALRPVGGLLWWLVLFLSLENLFVFTLGALIPLGFNDGSTLLKWWGKL